MLFSVEFLDFVLYYVQQFGVMLAVGTASVALVSYLASMRDGTISQKEEHVAHAIERVLGIGLGLMVLSGLAITGIHVLLSESSTIFLPAFTFKWLLIMGLSVAYFARGKKVFLSANLEGVIGGSFYALFIVHVMAPIVSWGNIIALYVVWMLGFMMVWSTLVFVITGKLPWPKKMAMPMLPRKAAIPQLIPATIPAVAVPKPIQTVQSVQPVQKVSPPIISAPVPAVVPQIKLEAPHVPLTPPPIRPAAPPTQVISVPVPPVPKEPTHSLWLPAMHVMPKSRKDMEENKHIIPAEMNITPSLT